ncbi:hypothetical protein [Frankia tisae]|uniref:hypothetical protein n=1 Tax=Frankia tisae TaxID=2950104 RepID=UPI0021BF4EFC|nr:hypothetical protein [Frankia tisae]
MELITMVLAAFPIGFFIRSRLASYLTYIAVHSFVFSFQSMELTREWTGGDDSAFPKNPHTVAWSYGAANLLIYAVGLGLVTLGFWLRNRRRTDRPATTPSARTVNLDA